MHDFGHYIQTIPGDAKRTRELRLAAHDVEKRCVNLSSSDTENVYDQAQDDSALWSDNKLGTLLWHSAQFTARHPTRIYNVSVSRYSPERMLSASVASNRQWLHRRTSPTTESVLESVIDWWFLETRKICVRCPHVLVYQTYGYAFHSNE